MIELDGTEDKSKLGANALLGVSMACARAGAAAYVISPFSVLPPLINLLTSSRKYPYTNIFA